MSEGQEMEGQQTVTEALQEGDGPTPEADALDARDAKTASGNPTAGDAPTGTVSSDDSVSGSGDAPTDSPTTDGKPPVADNADNPAASTAEDAPAETAAADTTDDTADEHYFRIMHQYHNPGADQPHSTVTSAPMSIVDAFDHLVAEGEKVGIDLLDMFDKL
jgi:hypothetical protein